MGQTERNYRKIRRGHVVSDKMEKTIVVCLKDRKEHPLYDRVIHKTRRVRIHDKYNAVGIGGLVVITEARPLNATKHWRLVEAAEKAK